ncbi:MAG: hypothetical protein ACI8X5_002774 [Planctomycetota bacterium]|jgi:hypothetical protein
MHFSTTAPSLLIASGLFLSLPLLAGCSEQAAEESQAAQEFVPYDGDALVRLDLTPLGDLEIEAPTEFDAASWLKLGDDGAIDGWKLHETKARSVILEGNSVLVITRTQGAIVEIPIALTLRDTPQISFNCVVRNQGYSIRAELLKDGVVLSTAVLPIVKAKSFQKLKMTFPAVLGSELRCDTIKLYLPPGKLPFVLESLSLEDVALGGYLPAEAFGALALIEIGSDSRQGTCISDSAGTMTSFEVESPEQELAFSFSMPRSIMRSGAPTKLLVSLEIDGADVEAHRYKFIGDDKTVPAWSHESIGLAKWQGKKVTARFELLSPDGSKRLAVLGRPQLVVRRERPPTVLLISSDTHRSDHLGFLGKKEGLQTDMLDKLAAAGVSFLNATSSINNTTPSHVALFTGLSPRDTGIVANAKRLAEVAPTLAECFADLGYATLAAVSAAPVCSQFSGLGQGFDRYSNPGYRSARDSSETLAQVHKWLADYEGRPLFVWLHIYDAHSPYDPPEELLNLYYPEHLKGRDGASPVADYSLAPDWDKGIADPVYTESAYMGEVSYVDQRLAELLSLERFWNGTIAFTADHGETLRIPGVDRWTHRGLSHANLAVPMIFKGHDLPAGTQRQAPVQQIDVGRTLLDISGHSDVDFPGSNVFDVAEDEPVARFALQANGFSASVLSGNWMLLFGLKPRKTGSMDPLDWKHGAALFDIEIDEACQNDLSEEFPERTAKLRRLVVRWLEESRRNSWIEAPVGESDDIKRKLTELGYVMVEGDISEDWLEADCKCANCVKFEK